MSPAPLPDSLGDRFLVVSRRLRRGFLQALEPWGVTPHQARALRVVAARGPLRLNALAQELHVAPRSSVLGLFLPVQVHALRVGGDARGGPSLKRGE